MSTTSLFGKLREHELEIDRLMNKKVVTRRTKYIVLKFDVQKKEESEKELDENGK